MSQKRLFGTDGIRSPVGAFPLDPPTVERTGWALATVLAQAGGRPRVLIGRDTRESGRDIEAALTRGLLSEGVRVCSGGVLTTPAVAFLTRAAAFDAGVVISASHNPYTDNGIKVFSRDGFKLPDRLEREVETLVLDIDDMGPEPGAPDPARHIYPAGSDPLLRTRYLAWLRSTLPPDFSLEGTRVVLDCANGAAFETAPELFRRLGAEVRVLSASPDGRNINLDCGALHPERLAEEVRSWGAMLGAAYDGDADRCILVDEQGHVRDGDDVLAVEAQAMLDAGTLKGGTVVGTVMANLGLELHLRSLGIEFQRAAVGDKYVLEMMQQLGAVLGGEQSGHVIFLDAATAGDGILTSLRVARTVATQGRPLSELASCWNRLPQVLENVRVREKADLATLPAVAAVIADAERRLDGRGRLLIRYSGTELKLRIMLEGNDKVEIDALAKAVASAVREAIGA